MPKRSRFTRISSMTDEELDEREQELEMALRQRNEALNSLRNNLGEKFTPLGDHQKFKEMQNFKQLRDREKYLIQEVQEEKRRRQEKREAANAPPATSAMSAAIAEYFAQQKQQTSQAAPTSADAKRMAASMAKTAKIHPSLASVYANAAPAAATAPLQTLQQEAQ
ncbi:Crnkl1, partial [Symbiodinium pilosum]